MVAVVVEPVESSCARLVDDAAGQGAVGEAVCKSLPITAVSPIQRHYRPSTLRLPR